MGAVFISYRRDDSEGQARALSLELEKLLGKDSVFMDVDSIALGRDFRQVLQERLETCDILLALVGPNWLDARDAGGNRRLESPNDYVRQEISAALKRNINVTPVLVQGAAMPGQDRLPDDLKDFAFRNGFELSHTRWESDVKELVRRLKARPKRKLLIRWLIAGAILLILAFLIWAFSGDSPSGSAPTTTAPGFSANLPGGEDGIQSCGFSLIKDAVYGIS